MIITYLWFIPSWQKRRQLLHQIGKQHCLWGWCLKHVQERSWKKCQQNWYYKQFYFDSQPTQREQRPTDYAMLAKSAIGTCGTPNTWLVASLKHSLKYAWLCACMYFNLLSCIYLFIFLSSYHTIMENTSLLWI